MTNMDYNEFEALLNDYLPEEGNTGSKVVGTVASKERNFAYLDVPGQITSVRVRAEEVENYNVGDEIEVMLVGETPDGEFIIGSRRKIEMEQGWEKIKEAFEKKEEITGKVVKEVKGGYIVEILSHQVFLPKSLSETRKGEDIVGETVNLLVKDIKEDKKVVKNDEYTIKIIPNKTDDVKLFTISKNMLRYVMASVVIMIVLVVGSLSFAGYVYFNNQADKQHLQELQEANALQQQQLSELDKKANSLKEDMDQLNNLENELKQLSGIEIPEGNNGDSVNPEQNGQGGPYPQTPTIENVRLTLDTVENTMNGKLNNMEELKKRLQTAIMMKRQQVAIANQTISITPSIWPAKGVVSSPYGLRWGGSDFHPGIDIANDMGTPIRATADGVVSIAGWNSGGYGNMVDIDHGNGVMTRYGHASYVVVSAGQQVKRGQIIAYMGSTGFSTGPHVHYEVRINGQAVDPSGYLFN